MKNVIKKISAIAMAFTLLGVGSVVTKTVAPQSDNVLVASAKNGHSSTCQFPYDSNTYVKYYDVCFYSDGSFAILGSYRYCRCCDQYIRYERGGR